MENDGQHDGREPDGRRGVPAAALTERGVVGER
jgi:hypothetical protein